MGVLSAGLEDQLVGKFHQPGWNLGAQSRDLSFGFELEELAKGDFNPARLDGFRVGIAVATHTSISAYCQIHTTLSRRWHA
jgi:hypothetical protein